jgi:hypothetical protein
MFCGYPRILVSALVPMYLHSHSLVLVERYRGRIPHKVTHHSLAMSNVKLVFIHMRIRYDSYRVLC